VAACNRTLRLIKLNEKTSPYPRHRKPRHTQTHRELSRDRVEAHVHGVLKVGRIGDIGFVRGVGRQLARFLRLDVLLLPIGVLRLLGQRPVHRQRVGEDVGAPVGRETHGGRRRLLVVRRHPSCNEDGAIRTRGGDIRADKKTKTMGAPVCVSPRTRQTRRPLPTLI
jgi:hypothetical protein